MILLQVLVAVRLLGGGSEPAVVEARYGADSTLELPAPAVREVLGVEATTPYVSVPALEHAYPDVTFTWKPRELELDVTDPRASLPATRAAQASFQRKAQDVSGLAWRTVSGVFGGVSADDSGRSATELGYTWRGRVVVSSAYFPALRRGTWAVSASPAPTMSLQAAGGRVLTSAALRVVAGPAFAFATWDQGRVALDALATLGGVSFFASSRQSYVLTINRAGLAIQVGRSPNSKTVRLSFGPQVSLSPFSLPYIPSR